MQSNIISEGRTWREENLNTTPPLETLDSFAKSQVKKRYDAKLKKEEEEKASKK